LSAVLARVGRYVPLDTSETTEILRRFAVARYQPVVVFGDATFETVARLEEHRAVLPGLVIQSGRSAYPDGKAVAHLVGYVSEVTETDLADNRFPGAQRGRSSARRASSASTTTPSVERKACGTSR
jgi:cell division protein FtsI/penicillin-binding protein 2